MDKPLAALAALFAAILGGGGIAALLKSRSQNRALDSDTLTKLTEATQLVYEKLTQDLREEIDRVIQRERDCRVEVRALQREVAELRRQLYATRVDIADLRDEFDQDGS